MGHVHHRPPLCPAPAEVREVTPGEGKPYKQTLVTASFTDHQLLGWNQGPPQADLMTTDKKNSSSLTILMQPDLENSLQGSHH